MAMNILSRLLDVRIVRGNRCPLSSHNSGSKIPIILSDNPMSPAGNVVNMDTTPRIAAQKPLIELNRAMQPKASITLRNIRVEMKIMASNTESMIILLQSKPMIVVELEKSPRTKTQAAEATARHQTQ